MGLLLLAFVYASFLFYVHLFCNIHIAWFLCSLFFCKILCLECQLQRSKISLFIEQKKFFYLAENMISAIIKYICKIVQMYPASALQ